MRDTYFVAFFLKCIGQCKSHIAYAYECKCHWSFFYIE